MHDDGAGQPLLMAQGAAHTLRALRTLHQNAHLMCAHRIGRVCLCVQAALEAVWHVPCGGITYGDDNLAFVANDWHTALLPVFLQVRLSGGSAVPPPSPRLPRGEHACSCRQLSAHHGTSLHAASWLVAGMRVPCGHARVGVMPQRLAHLCTSAPGAPAHPLCVAAAPLAAAASLLQAHYRDYGKMQYARCTFVIHNMAHQGRGPFVEADNLELNESYKERFRSAAPAPAPLHACMHACRQACVHACHQARMPDVTAMSAHSLHWRSTSPFQLAHSSTCRDEGAACEEPHVRGAAIAACPAHTAGHPGTPSFLAASSMQRLLASPHK